MTVDPNVFRAALLLIDLHGVGAEIQAAQWADEFLADGDLEGSAVWRQILAAIREVQRGRLESETLN